jgi:hypothetical protein
MKNIPTSSKHVFKDVGIILQIGSENSIQIERWVWAMVAPLQEAELFLPAYSSLTTY